MRFLYFLPIFICLNFSCLKKRPDKGPAAFFYWKTAFSLNAAERACLDSLSCDRLYIKYADIGKDPASDDARPYALLEVRDTNGLQGRKIVPCVFITNNTFSNPDAAKIDRLAKNTADMLRDIDRSFGRGAFSPPAVLFDCDWTNATRAAYFSFLRKIKKQLPAAVSVEATIRLHQYRNPQQTGIPPTDRGVLMCYNTGDVDDWETDNSILDIKTLRAYVDHAPEGYPLPFDLALPVFSWALVYRNGDLWKIIPALPLETLQDTARFTPLLPANNRFRVNKGTFQSGHFLRPDDLIRRESIDSALLEASFRAIKDVPFGRMLYFDLDSASLKGFTSGRLRQAGGM